MIWVFGGETTKVIQLFIVGVFVSFNLSQLGMIRHWTRHLKTERDPAARRRMLRSRAINTFGLGMTAVVLLIVLLTKFLAGAWITILAMGFFFLVMQAIGRHYARVELELAADEQDKVMPTRVHAIVLASKLHKPTLRALAFARATRPNVLEAIYVSIDTKATNRLLEEWDDRHLDIPLKVLHSPYREVVRPIVEYTQEIRRASPRGVVAVYIPEYVVGRWWEQLLHNQTALRLKGRLLFAPGVMVTSVPYQLRSSQIARGACGRGSYVGSSEPHRSSPWPGRLRRDMTRPRRRSPACTRSSSRFSRSCATCEDRSWKGTEMTMTPGVKSSRPLSRSAVWLCSSCSHQRPTTYSGM